MLAFALAVAAACTELHQRVAHGEPFDLFADLDTDD